MTTYADLLAQKESLDKQIEIARKAEAARALASVREMVQEFGFTAQQVFPWTPEEQKKRVAAKYYDPSSGATWTGRGKPPKWIEGKDRDQFLIL
ncbi:H-NS histone family protein [Acidovorax delafieldii]|jgi:DNA-binding protein H-NS|uniref:H-NS histone family protein n=1 Tax=Acidovorax delafieldii TaxID=47920 RepID=UPI0002F3D9E7|nr:H-NS histone family protein [Acidovorax delafieldii]